MKTKLRTPAISFLVLGLFILSCGLVSPATPPGQATAVDEATNQSPAEIATLPPAVVPTATVYPPVFDPDAIGDNRMLDSFILTRTDKTTGDWEGEEHQDTIGYIKQPFNAYELQRFKLGDVEGLHRKYSIDGRFYMTNASYDWLISLETPPDETGILQDEADTRWVYDTNFGPVSAQFAGQEDYQGMPANHFTFDQTDLRDYDNYDSYPGGYKIEKVEGDLYLSQNGNYLLVFHIKMTGNVYSPGGSADYFPGVREFSEELTSINQLKEITVPAEYLEPEQTLQDLGLPLPTGSMLTGMERFSGGLGVESYFFAASVSNDGFLDFYKNLAPTDGWMVSYIGIVPNHYRCGPRDCVILNKGGAQVILFYGNGGIGADYDREHIYAPQ